MRVHRPSWAGMLRGLMPGVPARSCRGQSPPGWLAMIRVTGLFWCRAGAGGRPGPGAVAGHGSLRDPGQALGFQGAHYLLRLTDQRPGRAPARVPSSPVGAHRDDRAVVPPAPWPPYLESRDSGPRDLPRPAIGTPDDQVIRPGPESSSQRQRHHQGRDDRNGHPGDELRAVGGNHHALGGEFRTEHEPQQARKDRQCPALTATPIPAHPRLATHGCRVRPLRRTRASPAGTPTAPRPRLTRQRFPQAKVDLLEEVSATGAHFLVRGSAIRKPCVEEILPDGSCLSRIDGALVRIIEATALRAAAPAPGVRPVPPQRARQSVTQ
jgi:hypothetical protein